MVCENSSVNFSAYIKRGECELVKQVITQLLELFSFSIENYLRSQPSYEQ